MEKLSQPDISVQIIAMKQAAKLVGYTKSQQFQCSMHCIEQILGTKGFIMSQIVEGEDGTATNQRKT